MGSSSSSNLPEPDDDVWSKWVKAASEAFLKQWRERATEYLEPLPTNVRDVIRVDPDTMGKIAREQLRLKDITGKKVSFTKLIQNAWRLYEDVLKASSELLPERDSKLSKKPEVPTELIGPIDLSTLGLTEEEMQALEDKAALNGMTAVLFARVVLTREINEPPTAIPTSGTRDKVAELASEVFHTPKDDLEEAWAEIFEKVARRRGVDLTSNS
jgi:hypothetical protein